MQRALAVLLVLSSGCFFGGDDGDDICAYDELAPALLVRDPQNGQCQSFGYGGDGNDNCGLATPTKGGVAAPDWGVCNGTCDAFDESACVAAAGCFATYVGPTFHGCWATAPSGPIHGTCTNLDAQECSRHDDCTAHYTSTNGLLNFDRCEQESSLDPGECFGMITCSTPSPACPSGTTPGIHNGCYTGYCIPLAQCPQAACNLLTTESSCEARTDCEPVYIGSDCTCYPDHCTCNVQTYDRCQSK